MQTKRILEVVNKSVENSLTLCSLFHWGRLLLRLLGLYGNDNLSDTFKSLHLIETPLTVEQHRAEPALQHLGAAGTLDVALAMPDQREHALDRIGRHQRLAQKSGYLEPGGYAEVR